MKWTYPGALTDVSATARRTVLNRYGPMSPDRRRPRDQLPPGRDDIFSGKLFPQIQILIVFSENSEGPVQVHNKPTTHTLVGHRWLAADCQKW